MNSRIVDYMRLFLCWVQRNQLKLDEVQREIHHKDPRVFLGTQRPGVKSLKTQGSVSLCLCIGVKHLSLLLNPPCLSPWNLFSPWLQYTCDSQMSLAVHSAPSQTSAPGESTCANLHPPLKLTQCFFYWIPIMCCYEQGELTILLCFHLYFQLRAWEPCFPWVFSWVFPRVSALISPHSHALSPRTSSPVNST